MVNEDKWNWIGGERIALDSHYWGLSKGKRMPWDDDGQAKFLTLHRKGDETTFANWHNRPGKFICQNYNRDDGKRLGLLLWPVVL